MKKVSLLFTLIMLLLTVAACGGKPESGEITLMLDWVPNVNHTGIFVAESKGYFEEAGLTVNIIQPGEVYAEQAVADEPNDPYLYGNLGVMYKQNYEFNDAILALKLAVRGGATPEGVLVEGLPLANGRIVEYYYNYGIALMELGYCGEAVDIAQSILQSINEDEIAIYNANFILDRCYQKMNDLQLQKLPTPTMIPTWTPQPTATATPAPTAVPTATLLP